MNEEILEAARARLLAERDRLEQQIEDLDGMFAVGEGLNDRAGELSSYDNHPGDYASETFERSKGLALRDAARTQLRQVVASLVRMVNGQYGDCATCGRQIDESRILALPHAILCIECKSHDEDWQDKFARPIEEKSLRYPFHYNGYDGEDAWQDAAANGASESPPDDPPVSLDELYVESHQRRVGDSFADATIDEPGTDGA